MNNKKELEFEKILEMIEDPNYDKETNMDLPNNPTSLQIAKFKLCKEILNFKIKNNLSRDDIAKKINLSKAEVERILFCHIEEFTLDRLVNYASELTNSRYAEIVLHPFENKLV